MAFIVIISPKDSNPPLEVTSFKVRMPRYGSLSIASYLANLGHEVRLFCEYTGSKIDWEVVGKADYICFSVMSFSARRACAMCDFARKRFGRPVIMGGSHASVLPEDALKHSDFVVRNEGEDSIVNLIDALENKEDFSSIPGLSYLNNKGEPVHNPGPRFDTDLTIPINMDVLPEYRPLSIFGAFKDTLINGIPRFTMPIIQTSRGCPQKCRFCFVKYELGSSYRKRPLEVVLEEIDWYLKNFKSRYLFFVDNDLLLDSEYACTLFDNLLVKYGPKLRFFLFSRLESSKQDALLRILERFDRTTIGVGVESLRDSVLKQMCKGQTKGHVLESFERFKKYKIFLQALFIFGGEDDTIESIKSTVDFCIHQKVFNIGMCALNDFPTRQLVLSQPQMIPDHHFIHRDWRFFSGNFVIHFPKRMRPSRLQKAINDGYRHFYRHRPDVFYQFMPFNRTIKEYINFLQKNESDFYNRNDMRQDEKLSSRKYQDLKHHLSIRVSPFVRHAEACRFLAQNLIRGVSWDFFKSAILPRR